MKTILKAHLLTVICFLAQDAACKQSKIIDMTHLYANEGMTFGLHPGLAHYNLTLGYKATNDLGVYSELNNFCTGEHTGTHIDAPRHNVLGRKGIDELALDDLIGDAVVIDVSDKAAENPDYQCTVTDIRLWESRHGVIRADSIFLLYTGWQKYWGNDRQYLGTDTGDWKLLRFPGLHPKAATFLLESRSIKLYGVDTLSGDYGQGVHEKLVHMTLLGANVPIIENVMNLDKLPPRGATVFAIPMKIKDGSGAPTRLFAMIDSGAAWYHLSQVLLIAASTVAASFTRVQIY
ncbi:PREDICTED: kynurenine formamidase-like [Priapulus caudatus]|uniref:Kynurenine formamidase-like n=1 Tax=Priapulus caudatus TaxID=37621 RepID=A0ABM1E659_PRICU|nr:PREDICTED: kynurenine formamidase-like [Priapulus caudatus]